MTWKVINIGSTGTSTKFGGNDLDKVSKLFSNIDVDDVVMNSDWTWKKPQVTDNYIDLKAITAPSAPASGYIRLYIDSTDGKIKFKRSNGEVVILE